MVGGTSSARGMRSASELRDLMDTLQRKKIALENSLRANGSANPSYFSVTQVSHDFLSKSVWLAWIFVSLDICLGLNMTNQDLLII